jgi:hypothetical protein
MQCAPIKASSAVPAAGANPSLVARRSETRAHNEAWLQFFHQACGSRNVQGEAPQRCVSTCRWVEQKGNRSGLFLGLRGGRRWQRAGQLAEVLERQRWRTGSSRAVYRCCYTMGGDNFMLWSSGHADRLGGGQESGLRGLTLMVRLIWERRGKRAQAQSTGTGTKGHRKAAKGTKASKGSSLSRSAAAHRCETPR